MLEPITTSVELVSEDSLIIRFQHAPQREHQETCDLGKTLTHAISVCRSQLMQRYADVIIDCIPAYSSLSVMVDFPSHTPQDILEGVRHQLRTSLQGLKLTPDATQSKCVIIPCCYDPRLGIDLENVSDSLGLSVEDVIALHTRIRFCVRAIGFSPGFPYLGTLPKQLRIPRRSVPRARVAAGSVAIAEDQCAIYPQATPGGWNIIGQTPIRVLNTHAATASEVSALDTGNDVIFKPISYAAFLEYDAMQNETV